MTTTLMPGSHEPEPERTEIAEMIDDVVQYSNTYQEQVTMHPASQESLYYGCDRRLGATAINSETLARARARIAAGFIALERYSN